MLSILHAMHLHSLRLIMFYSLFSHHDLSWNHLSLSDNRVAHKACAVPSAIQEHMKAHVFVIETLQLLSTQWIKHHNPLSQPTWLSSA